MPRKAGKRTKFRKLLEQELRKSGRRTLKELADAAKVPIASVSMVMSGHRSLSPRTAIRLAKALLPPGSQEWQRLTEQLLAAANKSEEENGSSASTAHSEILRTAGSVADRVLLDKTIHAGYIVNPPFVLPLGGGFAIDFYEHLARVMGFTPNMERIEFSRMHDALAKDEVDIVITALLPTFRRSQFMSFSPPLPYLKVPLSGLFRSNPWKEFGLDLEYLLSLDHARVRTFKRDQNDEAGQNAADRLLQAKFLFVKGEVGEEFAHAFFDHKLMMQLQKTGKLFTPSDPSPEGLAKILVQEQIDLLIADIATCKNVMDELNKLNRSEDSSYEPLTDPYALLPELNLPEGNHPRTYWQFASYPVVFGFKKGDAEWETMIREAFSYMLTEGIRAVLAIYRKYNHPTQYPDFHDWYFTPTIAEESISSLTHSYFKQTFKAKFKDE